ncbi:MAG: SGNH/GDSL hydrolase family protein [Candidatus Saccharibacteria bacterium]|nr:SGNH/GDSL hydrolase family protein [Candidatus Saccharibacteria bacterium]
MKSSTGYRMQLNPRLRSSIEAKLNQAKTARPTVHRTVFSLAFLVLIMFALVASATGIIMNSQSSMATIEQPKTIATQKPLPISGSSSGVTFTKNYSKTVGFIGDSLTFGAGATPAPIVEMALIGPDYKAINQSVSGTTTRDWTGQLLDESIEEFKSNGVEVVQIMLGTNDMWDSKDITIDEAMSNMQLIIDRLRANGVKLIIVNQIPYSGVHDDSKIRAYNQRLTEVSFGDDAYLGDTEAYDYFANHPEMLYDKLHMTPEGYVKLAEMWADDFRRLVLN